MSSKEDKLEPLFETVSPRDANLQARSKGKGKKKSWHLKGVFIQGEKENHNKRVYPRQQISNAVDSLMERINNPDHGEVYGELDHPPTMVVNLKNASHVIESIYMDGNNGIGNLRILGTPSGEICKTLIEEKLKLGVSSRGNGSVDMNGNVENYQILTVDIVATPSAQDAYPEPIFEMMMNFRRSNQLMDVAGAMIHENDPERYRKHYETEVTNFIEHIGRNFDVR